MIMLKGLAWRAWEPSLPAALAAPRPSRYNRSPLYSIVLTTACTAPPVEAFPVRRDDVCWAARS
jgi:hypothetical protein